MNQPQAPSTSMPPPALRRRRRCFCAAHSLLAVHSELTVCSALIPFQLHDMTSTRTIIRVAWPTQPHMASRVSCRCGWLTDGKPCRPNPSSYRAPPSLGPATSCGEPCSACCACCAAAMPRW